MTENMMKHLIMEDKVSKIVGPIVCIYLLWLALMAMLNFKVMMIAIAVQFVVFEYRYTLHILLQYLVVVIFL